MAEVFTRTFTPELEIMTRAQGGDGRTVRGIAVPYGRPQRIDSQLVEQFARSAFNAQLDPAAVARVPFTRDHLVHGGTLLGRAQLLRDDAAGLYGEWRVSRTLTGDETLALIEDDALRQLSIGFREGQNRYLTRGGVAVTERVTAMLREVAVVLEGAYGDGAVIAGVRSAAEFERLDQARQIAATLPELPARV